MSDFEQKVDRLAIDGSFSGVIRIDRHGKQLLWRAYGFADRAHRIQNTPHTRFGIASGTKLLTATVIMRLVDEGLLAPDQPVRSLLGADLSLIDDAVTIEHLLSHRSGIGDYLDEEALGSVDDYVMPVPVHRLVTSVDYLPMLDGLPQKFSPGARFAYCNSGYVVLALVAERAGGAPFGELLEHLVCRPAGLGGTGFLRSDELPGDAAVGYLQTVGLRTNTLHLPVRGSGDGGLFSTAQDVHTLWTSLFSHSIVSPAALLAMTDPHPATASRRYGLGLWIHPDSDSYLIEGYDAGVSFQSVHAPHRSITHTVLSNTSEGAWELAHFLRQEFETWPG